MNILGT